LKRSVKGDIAWQWIAANVAKLLELLRKE